MTIPDPSSTEPPFDDLTASDGGFGAGEAEDARPLADPGAARDGETDLTGLSEEVRGRVISGRVISGGDARVEPLYATSRLLKSSLLDVDRTRAEASQVLEDAKKRAEAMLADAEARVAARQEGIDAELQALRDAARDEARTDAKKQLGRLLESFQSACQESYGRFPEWVRESAFKVARHVVDVEFSTKPELIREFVERALGKARRSATVIHLHPDDVVMVEPMRDELIERHGLPDTFQVVEAQDVERHSVRIETGVNRAAYHLGVDELFDELKKQIQKKVGR